jgi:uncharacterized protein (TIGR02466 family)|tara:strand:- start:106 stop:693 length:588 start_codon:yes stop_codon:yes gene_type:complete
MAIEGWFQTPTYYEFLHGAELTKVQAEINDTLSSIEFSKHKAWGETNHSLSDPTFKTNYLDKYKLSFTKKLFIQHVKQYLSVFKNEKYTVKIENSWLTSTNRGEHTTVHNHGGFDISGVYYFQTNKNDGSLYLMNPITSLVSSHYFAPDECIYYHPEVGKLVLFPSWIYHGVRPNDTDDTRISLSFNAKISFQNG